VLDPEEALEHTHNRMRHPEFDKESPVKAPLMRATSGPVSHPDISDCTEAVLDAAGLSASEIAKAKSSAENIAGLAWPPL
jgi:hypothetical protein